MKYNNGTNQWEHEQARSAYPEDWHKLLGPCPECGNPCFDYGGGWRCQSRYCKYSSTTSISRFGPPPSWWNTGINVIKDGNAWMAHGEDFINLHDSHVGFGDLPSDAIKAFLEPKTVEP